MNRRNGLGCLAGAAVVLLLVVELFGSARVGYSQAPTADIKLTQLERTINVLVIQALSATARQVNQALTATARDADRSAIDATVQARIGQIQTATAQVVSSTPTPTGSGIDFTQTMQAAIDDRSTAVAQDQAAGGLRNTALAFVRQTQTAAAGAISPTPTPTISGVELTQTLQAAVDERSTAVSDDQASRDLRNTALAFVRQTQTSTAGAVAATPTPTLSGVELTQTMQAAIDERWTAVVQDQKDRDLRSTALALVRQTQTAMAPTESPTPTPTPKPAN